jgi:hypothetical protein
MAVRWADLGVANAWSTLPASMCSANCEIWRRWHYSVGCFSWNVLGPLVILHGTLNAEGYKDILTRRILSTVKDKFGDDSCLYQHENAPCHTSRSVREWSVASKVPEMDWSGQSPDLNPAEHLWGELKHRLRSRPQRPTTPTALATALQEKWAAIPPETFRHLVERPPTELELS